MYVLPDVICMHVCNVQSKGYLLTYLNLAAPHEAVGVPRAER